MALSKIAQQGLWMNPQGYLFGLTMSTAGASTTLSVAAGLACDSTGQRVMKLASTMAKTTSAWALGSAAGGLDTGAIAASTWYHWFIIQRPDTLAVDVLFSLSATAPTLPANYTLFRRIGAMKTNGSSQWTSFTQVGDEFMWAVPTQDGNAITVGTAVVTLGSSSPPGVQCLLHLLCSMANTTQNAVVAPLVTTSPTPASGNFNVSGGGTDVRVLTNTLGQFGCIAAAASSSFFYWTYSWTDFRGKLN